MNPARSRSQQRILALALAALVIASLYFALLHPLITYLNERDEERAAALRLLGRNRALVQQAPQIRTALDSVARSSQWSRFFEAQKPTDATLQLETDLRTLITAPNQPTSMIAEPPAAQGPLTRVSVKVTLSVTIDQLSDLLARCRQHPRFLKIENLVVQAPDAQVVDANPLLSVQAEISGFMVTPSGGKS